MRATKLHNRPLLLFCTCVIFLVVLSVNGLSQENEGADASEALALQDRLQGIENDIIDLKNVVGQDELAANIDQIRDEIDSLRDDLSNDVMGILGLRISIVSNLIAIFIGLIAFFGAASYFMSWYIKQRVTKHALKKANILIDKLLYERISFARDFTMSQMLARLSYTYFDYYKVDFRATLNGVFPDDKNEILRISRGASFARHLAEEGLHWLDNIEDRSLADDKFNIQHLKAGLLNYYTYHLTVEMICIRKDNESVDEDQRINLLTRANECISLVDSKEPIIGMLWYELHDSAARAMIQIGGGEVAEKGRELIKDICDGKRPSEDHVSVPDDRIRTFQGDFNLTSDEESDGQSESSSAQ